LGTDENSALRALHEHDKADHRDDIARKMTMKTGRDRPVRPTRGSSQSVWEIGDDAGENDQRDPVADAARGDLLAEPHQKDVPLVSVTPSPGENNPDRRLRIGRPRASFEPTAMP